MPLLSRLLPPPTSRVLSRRALFSSSFTILITPVFSINRINSINRFHTRKMSLKAFVERLRSGAPPEFPQDANSLQFAQSLDSQDSIRHLRDEFILPTKASLKKRALDGTIPGKQGKQASYTHTHTHTLSLSICEMASGAERRKSAR
jgi:hypothetical protein